ncbi:hypothetical protein ABFS83_10G107900 [Erythranthe nasuta]
MYHINSGMEAPHNIVLLPPPSFLGHLIPFIELAKKLIFDHNCTVTLIILDDGSSMEPQRSLLQDIPTAINPVFLPPLDILFVEENLQDPQILLPKRVIQSLPALKDTLSSLREMKTPATALVVDLFAPYAIDIAREFGIPAYIFYVVAANELWMSIDLPKLEKESNGYSEQIMLPGSIVLNPGDFHDSMKDINSDFYKMSVDMCHKYRTFDGILVNSFLGLESEAFRDLEKRRPRIPPVYPVGPLIRTTTSEEDHEYCIKWLNDQPHKSVLFVSFGSGGTLSMEQFTELALGLEMSGHRFLWVVRTPQENTAAAYLNNNHVDNNNVKTGPLEFLPKGFLERTKDRGLVVAKWAPQIRVLGHGSVGGFVTHCGWNSVLESTVYGVPMIAWPLCFEQRMSAVFVRDGLRGALRVKPNKNGLVEKQHFSQVVKQLMEGEQGKSIRKRMTDAEIAAGDVMDQHCGSSVQALAQLVRKWKNTEN